MLGSPGGFPFFSHPLRGGIGCSFDFIFVIFCRSLSTTVVAYGADDRLAAVTDVYVTDDHLLAGLPTVAVQSFNLRRESSQQLRRSVDVGICLDGKWYVTHAGLLRLSSRRRCSGIQSELVSPFCGPSNSRWTFKATVFRAGRSEGFVGYGDAEPSNVSAMVHGAEMRVAETRAVNRALRKAYGIGICSVEEIGSHAEPSQPSPESKKLPPQPTNGNGSRSVRDRLCQVIRQHQLDPNLVKAYATDFCAVTALRDATREQVEAFVAHLADWAEKDRNALLCQLNSFFGQKEGAA